MNHTPTPYEARAWGETISIDSLAPDPDVTELRIGVAFVNPRGHHGRGIPSKQDRANAEFIVHACNLHDELMRALEDARDYIMDRLDPNDPAPPIARRITEIIRK